MSENGLVPKQMQRIEQLVTEIEALPDSKSRDMSVELVQLLMEFYGQGLARMMSLTAESGAAGSETMSRFMGDPLVANLLMLHNLHPVDLPTRVERALTKVRPLLHSHGGDVELLGIDDGTVRLRLQGSCHGCPSSAMTLKHAIEEAIFEFAPDVAGLDVAGVVDSRPSPPSSGFVPLEALQLR
jgi:Fe-S cluster biogenesis protein NfuA